MTMSVLLASSACVNYSIEV